MKRILCSAAVFAALLALEGCMTPTRPLATNGPSFQPYDFEANPYCGVYGTCQPAITEPFRIIPWDDTGS